MSIIRINAITVPAEAGDELAHRFAARAGAVDGADGFEGFELLKPTDGRTQWLVVTRWRDEASFDAWVALAGLRPGSSRRGRRCLDGGHPGGHPGGHRWHPGGHGGGEGGERPVGVGSEVWAYEPVVTAGARLLVLLEIHQSFAWFVIISNGLAGLWVLAANWLERVAHAGACGGSSCWPS